MQKQFVLARLALILVCSSILLIAPFVVLADTPFDCTLVTEIPCEECEALVALYNATGGDNWTDNTNWLQNNQPSSWYGVAVSEGHVITLRFWRMMLPSMTRPFLRIIRSPNRGAQNRKTRSGIMWDR